MMTTETPFDIRAIDAIDPDDEEAEVLVEEYLDDLSDAFLASNEGAALVGVHEGHGVGRHAVNLAAFGWSPVGSTPATMTVADLEEVVAVLFPAHVTFVCPAEAEDIVPELRAFWRWLGREHGVEGVEEKLARLDELEPDLPAMMIDPERFGPTKEFTTAGFAAGYDMYDGDQIEEFAAIYYDDDLPESCGPPPDFRRDRAAAMKKAAKSKQKRKLQKASRKRNRRK
jgi:hypothetical protein